jgi:hypothetical protein
MPGSNLGHCYFMELHSSLAWRGLKFKTPGKQRKSANNWQSLQNKALGFFNYFSFSRSCFLFLLRMLEYHSLWLEDQLELLNSLMLLSIGEPEWCIFLLRGTLTNLRNCDLRTHEKRAMSLLSICCCQIDYTIQGMARPREKTWMTKQIKLIWRSMVCNGVNETRCEKYCAKEKVGLDWYVTTGLYFVFSALTTPLYVTLRKTKPVFRQHSLFICSVYFPYTTLNNW